MQLSWGEQRSALTRGARQAHGPGRAPCSRTSTQQPQDKPARARPPEAGLL